MRTGVLEPLQQTVLVVPEVQQIDGVNTCKLPIERALNFPHSLRQFACLTLVLPRWLLSRCTDVHKNSPIIGNLNIDLEQGVRLLVKVLKVFELRCLDQISFKIIAPSVILAAKGICTSG